MEGKELKKVIMERFGSQAAFARAAGIPQCTLSTILRHERITGVNAQRIQRAFNKRPQRNNEDDE
jgi:predicted transcriptional regulator